MSTIVVTKKDEITVACTWGDGPDVLMDICRDDFQYPIDLTALEARKIAAALIEAADQSDELDALAAQEGTL